MNAIASALQPSRSPKREAALLICCATSLATLERTARLGAIVDAGVDWQLTAHMASMQAVMPLVYRYLTAELDRELPADAAGSLRVAFYGNSVRNLHLARELVRLTALLERGGVEPLALKGPALAVSAYGALALRQFTDLDLLVRKSEVGRAAAILRDEGYAPRPGYALDDLDRPGTFEIALTRTGALTEIDLHWRLIPPYFPLSLDGEDLWRRAVRVDIEGAAVRTLAPADHLLYLCAHGAKHGWQALGGICDLAELIRRASRDSSSSSLSIDWDDLRARATRAGAHRALGLGLLLAHELFDAAVPADALEAARRERAVVRAARGFIGYVSDPANDGPGFYQRWSVPLRVIDKPRARLRYLAARALLPSADDREFLRLPPALYPLYFLLRPLRVALKEAPMAARRLMRSVPRPVDGSQR